MVKTLVLRDKVLDLPSGGQKQRLILARAFFQRPYLILFDNILGAWISRLKYRSRPDYLDEMGSYHNL